MAELSLTAEARGVMPYCHDTFDAETGEFDPSTGRGRSYPDYTYGAHAVEVEVDADVVEPSPNAGPAARIDRAKPPSKSRHAAASRRAGRPTPDFFVAPRAMPAD